MVKANLKYIDDNFNFKTASKIVYSGFSAGALGVVFWTDYLQSILDDPSVLSIIPDSGILMDAQPTSSKNDFGSQLKVLYQLSNLN